MSSIYDNRAYRARILHLLDDPARVGDSALQYFEDGILWIQDGKIKAVGPADQLLPLPFNVSVREYPNHLIIPGFIDSHVHYPQTGMIGAHGNQLLDWLTQYTFPAEAEFGDVEHARSVAEFFLQELLRNGTTTALVFCTVHPQSVNALFSAAKDKNLCLIAGKVLMDRNAPPELLDTPECAYEQSKKLIERWHNVDRLRYAVTPRFAPTSSPEQLQVAGRLLQEYPDLYLHTHLAENTDEVKWVQQLFPQAQDYLQVYEDAGLVGRRSVFAHGVHLCDSECQRLAAAGATVAHCPTSNLFLGSGLFDLQKMQQHGVHVALGTDVGAGTSFSLFRTLDEAYKIQQLQGVNLDPLQAFYFATLGAARALSLDHCIGNLQAGKDGDFVILDLDATPLLAYRLQHCRGPEDLLFVLNTLGDDRLVQATYAAGQCVHRRGGHG
jgi:guanine deaminase